MPDIRESPSGPLVAVEGGETGITLTSVRYVDPATALDPENQTGSDEAPFATLQQALDSIAAAELTNATIFLIDGDYQSAGATYAPIEDDILQIVGFGSAQNIGAFVIAPGSGSSRLTFRSLSVSPNVFSFTSNTTGGTYEFIDMIVSGVIDALSSTVNLLRATTSFVVQTSFIDAESTIFEGNVVAESTIEAESCDFQGGLNASDGELHACTVAGVLVFSSADVTTFLSNCRLASIQASSSPIVVYDTTFSGTSSFLTLTAYSSRFTGNMDVVSDAELNACQLGGEVFAGGSLVANDTTFAGAATFANQNAGGSSRLSGCVATATNNLAGDVLTVQSCIWPGAITAISSLQLIDTYMYVDTGPAALNSPAQIEIIGSRLAGDVTAGSLIIDTVSWQAGISGGLTFTQTTRQVTDLPLSATISINVPAVAAGAVGYVTTSLVGSALEGIFTSNEAVIVNPQSDLVAAGAGGGFINARINGTDSLRSAFLGPLAGGAANFTVTRGR